MVKLSPEQQQTFVRQDPATFVPESGAWGRQGCTAVQLKSIDEETLGEALTLAWQNTVRELAAKRSKPKSSSRQVRSSRKR